MERTAQLRVPRQSMAADRDPGARACRAGRCARVRKAASAGRAPAVADVRPGGRPDRGSGERQPVPPLSRRRAGRERGAAIADAVPTARLVQKGEDPRRRTSRSSSAAWATSSPSASTPPASGCTGAAPASRRAARPCAKRWPPGCWRWPAGPLKPLWSIRCAAPGQSSSRPARRRWTAPPGSIGRSRSSGGRCSPAVSPRRPPSACAIRRAGARGLSRRHRSGLGSGSEGDRDARRNAARAGVESALTFVCQDVADARPPAAGGLVVVNPPYGRRIGDPRAAARAYRESWASLARAVPGLARGDRHPGSPRSRPRALAPRRAALRAAKRRLAGDARSLQLVGGAFQPIPRRRPRRAAVASKSVLMARA